MELVILTNCGNFTATTNNV